MQTSVPINTRGTLTDNAAVAARGKDLFEPLAPIYLCNVNTPTRLWTSVQLHRTSFITPFVSGLGGWPSLIYSDKLPMATAINPASSVSRPYHTSPCKLKESTLGILSPWDWGMYLEPLPPSCLSCEYALRKIIANDARHHIPADTFQNLIPSLWWAKSLIKERYHVRTTDPDHRHTGPERKNERPYRTVRLGQWGGGLQALPVSGLVSLVCSVNSGGPLQIQSGS